MFHRYSLDIIKKHAGPFLLCFFSLMLLLLMQFLVLHVDHLVGKGLPFQVVIELIGTNLAYMVVLAVPMAVLVSTVIAFGTISEWNELTAIRAAGINPVRLIFPVLGIGLILFAALALFSNEILPEANHKARSLFIDIRMAKPGFDLKEGVFYEGIDGYAFLVEEIDHEADTLHHLTILQDARNSKNRAFITAKKGWLRSENERVLSLVLEDGEMIRYLPTDGRSDETLEISTFSTYRMSFDLSELVFSRVNPEQRTRNDRTMRAQAMLAVADSIAMQTEREFQRFLERSGQPSVVPFRQFEQITEARGTDAIQQKDTPKENMDPPGFEAVNSSYIALRMANDAESQLDIADRARNSVIRYDSEYVQYQGNTRHNRSRRTKYLVEVHKKLSIPFASVLFVMIGAPIGLLTRKGNIGFASLVSACIIAIYFSAIIQGERLADRMVITPFWGMWGINFFLFIVGLGLISWVGRPVDRLFLSRRTPGGTHESVRDKGVRDNSLRDDGTRANDARDNGTRDARHQQDPLRP